MFLIMDKTFSDRAQGRRAIPLRLRNRPHAGPLRKRLSHQEVVAPPQILSIAIGARLEQGGHVMVRADLTSTYRGRAEGRIYGRWSEPLDNPVMECCGEDAQAVVGPILD